MNERIKELANIAAGHNIKTSPAVASDIADWAVIEKFAELIVRECLLKANGAKIRGETIDELIERIKDDFGVE